MEVFDDGAAVFVATDSGLEGHFMPQTSQPDGHVEWRTARICEPIDDVDQRFACNLY